MSEEQAGYDLGNDDDLTVTAWADRAMAVAADARTLAAALAGTLDTGGHMAWCSAWNDRVACDYEPCRVARAALAMARQRGWADG